MLSKIFSSAVVGLDAVIIEVEVDVASQGLPAFTIVGLPDKAVDESKERVRSAIKNTGADFPAKRITVNLAPADLPKEGPSYDLAMAIGILIGSSQLLPVTTPSLFIGELSLDGSVRKVPGVLPQAISAKENNIQELFIPAENAKEASIVEGITIYPVASLKQLLNHLSKIKLIEPQPYESITTYYGVKEHLFDMQDVKGQEQAKRGFEIAAAGSHNILLKGPPGAGKTLLARTLPSILPELTIDEALEITKIHSISGLLQKDAFVVSRPFRSPHHTTSHIGLIGGGTVPKPGEVSLAHRGVLFLDEFPEFPRNAIEVLRQPLEDGFVTISRAQGRIRFPAKFMLVAAQNPCPCGYFGDPVHQCTCSTSQVIKYQRKISGPLLDRIDIHLEVPAVKIDKLTAEDLTSGEASKTIRLRVQKARDMQIKRFAKTRIKSNAEMNSKDIKDFCPLTPEVREILKLAISKLNLSARSYYRTIKLARTIADLEGVLDIQEHHVAEALQYKPKSNPL